MSFRWIPGTPLSAEAIERLEQHFPKPEASPPQAWFMGDVSYWGSILESESQELIKYNLDHYLQDTSSGLRNFPEVKFAIKSWKDTFLYLLPRLLPYVREGYLLADLIGYFIHVYPEITPDIYPEFRSDILQTLGIALMAPEFWDGTEFSNEVIEREHQTWILQGENDFIISVSSAIYFCLKYLTTSEMEAWCESLFQINGIHWHYNLMYWLYHETFSLLLHFEDDNLPEIYAVHPNLHIGVNARVTTIHLPTENVKLFIRMLKKHRIYYGKNA